MNPGISIQGMILAFPSVFACSAGEVSRFSDGRRRQVSSNGGVLLLQVVDRRLGLSAAAARVLRDPRDRGRCRHSALAQLQQHIYGLALGYEDLNDHGELRHDLALQTAVDPHRAVGERADAVSIRALGRSRAPRWPSTCSLVDQFIASFAGRRRRRSLLDFDATDVPVAWSPGRPPLPRV